MKINADTTAVVKPSLVKPKLLNISVITNIIVQWASEVVNAWEREGIGSIPYCKQMPQNKFWSPSIQIIRLAISLLSKDATCKVGKS